MFIFFRPICSKKYSMQVSETLVRSYMAGAILAVAAAFAFTVTGHFVSGRFRSAKTRSMADRGLDRAPLARCFGSGIGVAGRAASFLGKQRLDRRPFFVARIESRHGRRLFPAANRKLE